MRVNHDANINRLIDKYGVKPLSGKAKHWKRVQGDQPWRPTKKQLKWLKKGGKMRLAPAPQTYVEILRDYLRWKKTPAFQKWSRKQFLDQGGTCYYCDVPLHGMRENVDHVLPIIAGGTNNPKNLVLACWKCNKEKYTKILKKKELKALAAKNTKKKGTYHKLKELYLSEEEFAIQLREIS